MYSNRWAYAAKERYEAAGARRNPAYIHDDDTNKMYKYNGSYNQTQFPDSHNRSFSAISREIDYQKPSKKAHSLLAPACLGVVFLAVALVIGGAVVIAIMTVVVNDDVIYPDVVVVGGSSTKGEITLSDETWDSTFEDSSSEEYQSLESDFIEQMDNTYRRSNLEDVYNHTTVEQFRQGSVIVVFLVHLNGATPSAKQIQAGDDTEQLQVEVKLATVSDVLSVLNSETADDSYLGELPVGEASVTEVVSVIIEVQEGNSENQPPETEPPSVTCPADITQNTDDESSTTVVSWEDPVAEDNSGVIDRIETQPESGSEFTIGETEVTVLAYDAAGNIGLCTFTVTVMDVELPSVICPSNITENVTESEATRVVTWLPPEATDNSGGDLYIDTTPVSGHAFPIGVTSVEVTVRDPSENSVSCTFFVNILDNERPVVTCPADIAVDTDPGQSIGSVTWSTPAATDNSGQSVSLSSDLQPGNYDIGQHVVTYTGEDESGNTAQCSFNVIVTDNERPVVTCPANIAVDTDPGQSTGSVTWSTPTATDNSGQSVSLSSVSQPGNFDIGQHVVTYTGEDESGNTAQCSFIVTVTDNERPVVTCPADVFVDTDPGLSTGSVTWSTPTATDNSGQSVSLSSDLQPGSYAIGQHVVIYTGEDESGNTAQCSFTFTVTDKEPPVISCPPAIYNKTQMGELSGYITWAIPPPTDNSGNLVTYETDYQPGVFPIGSYTVNATATDVYGNTAWCTFMFVVEPLCHPEFCLNEGNCSFSPLDNAYVCQCPEGILGKNCEFEIPDTDVCGTNPLFPSTRIVGGEIAYPGSWPWQVFLDYRVYLCGATLITNQWILTAAHCVGDPGMRANLDAIIVGEVYLTNTSVSRVNRSVERIVVHPGYQTTVIDNDIALIQLAEPVEFDDFVRPACLPSDSNINEEEYYSKCYATGWGRTDEYGDISMILLQAEIPLINRTVCDEKLKALGSLSVTENMICGGIDERSTCRFNKFMRLPGETTGKGTISLPSGITQGDSGGPLVCQEADGRWTLVGITSWGYICGEPESPSVFVRVSKYLEYIESVIQGNPVVSCEPVNSGCQMNLPYTETFTTSQSQIEYYVDNLYRYYFQGLDPSVCDIDMFNTTMCSFFFKGCDQAIVPCRQYCESIHLPCLQDDYFCTFLPYGPPGEQWCIEGKDYCGEQNIHLSEDSRQVLKNPFLGNYNRANRDCIWLITGPAGYSIVVKVQFLSIDISTHTLSVGRGRDPDRRSSTIMKLYEQTQLVVIEDHEGWIRFETMNERAYSGFSALLMVTDREHGNFPCMEGSLVCSNLCLPMDWLCDGIQDCQTGEDEANCTITDFSVEVFLTEDAPDYFLLSPGYPQYPLNLNATWLFTCPEGFVIRITFLMVETLTCCDIIVVSDHSGQNLLRWSGYMWNEKMSVTSRGNMLLVSFQTNDFGELSGFLADVELLNYTGDDVFDCDERYDCGQGVCIPFSGVCNDVINCFEGVDETCSESIFVNSSYIFNSPNFPSEYPNNFEFTWYFSTDPGSQLLITFSAISTEPGYDYIYVREGSNISAVSDLLLRWSGTGSPDELRILSSENLIWVTFESDESVTYNGFVATVEATNMTREELNCGTEFDCDNGVCLPQSKVCDGRRTCGNNADETNGNCTDACGPSEFSCYDGSCIPGYWQCDGFTDCNGGEDELWCSGPSTCGPSDFSCYDGDCVDRFLVCDGYPHCSGGEDEFGCHETEAIFVNSSYIFNSPNFPSEYPDNFEFTWYFSTDPGSQLLITFSAISTERGFDYIYVREGSNISAVSDLLLQWSGKGSPDELRILSSESLISVTFESDGSVTYNGFVATVEATNMTREELNCGTEFDCENGVCLPQSKVCDGRRECGNNVDENNRNCPGTCGPWDFSCYDGGCIDSFLVCDGNPDCSGGEDESWCNGTDYSMDVFLTEDEPYYFLVSPGYPRYPPNLNATSLFTCPEGFVIRITFLMVETQTCCDIIVVSDETGQSLLRWSGYLQNRNLSVTSRGNTLLVSFQTNEFVEYSGFAADVELLNYTGDHVFDCDERFDCGQGVCIPFSGGVCNGVINCLEGVDEICSESIFVNSSYTFNSLNYPSKYPTSFVYTWYFSTDPGSQLLITFSVLSTEPNYDLIYIREGSNISAISDLLLRWSGTGSPNELRILSSESIIWVMFVSDEIIAYNGFVATVEATNMTREELNCGTEFDCENGVCLPQSKVCDGRRECGNHADETNGNCTAYCAPWEFSCYDGGCIDWSFVCDGNPNCSGGEDEFWCNGTYTCSPSDFMCFDGDCFPEYLRCDGYPDCSGGEDEFWCNGTDCGFFCNNMTCISSSLLCDGTSDCDEGEDESTDTCGGDIFLNQDSQMYVMSPNYPNDYPDNFNVSWKIATHQGYVLEVKFISFQTEHFYDFITIDEFDDITFMQLIKKWSGNDTSLQVSTSTHQMRVNFHSDGSVNAQGFQGIVTSIPGNATSSCPASYFDCGNGACFSMEAGCDLEINCGNNADAESCSGNPNRCNLNQFSCGDVCIENELVCDYTSHCLNDEDEASFCDEVLYIPENTVWNITSPDYPSPYPANSNHTWYFRTDPGVQILVYFLAFTTEESYDFVTIGDGLQVSSHLLLEWSGFDPSVSILSMSNHLWFNFQSDELLNYDGFEAVAYAVRVAANDSLECDDYQFSCSGSVCLPSSVVCDGIMSCASGEDEENCIDIPTTEEDPTTIFGPSPHEVTTTSQTTTLPGVSTYPSGNSSRCGITEFRCGDICIKNELVCNGMFDCPEFGDEMICDRVLHIPENTVLNITSPDYPSPYPDSSNHTWYFRTDPGVQILVYFLSFATEESFDFVTIGDGLQVSSHLLLEWSGSDPSVSVLSTSNHLWFNFQSDELFNDDGFEAVTYAVKLAANDSLECEDYQFSCSGSVCLPSYAVCDDVISCGSGQDETNCTGTACPEDFFECSDGVCFSSLLVCDGIPHCTDGGDEATSLCVNETDSGQCTSVPSYCQQYLPYNTTRFPHQFASDITDAEDIFQKLMPFLSCHDNATAFVCAALYPDCQDIGVIVEPCNTTCFEVVQSCEPVYFNGTEELWPFTCFHYGNSFRQAENGYCLAVRYLVSVSGSILMNQTFSEELLDRDSDAYQSLAVQFITECDSLFSSSFLLDNSYLGTKIDGFSAGSVNISFQVFLNQLVDGDATLTATVIHVTMEDAIDFQTHFQSLPLLWDTLITHPANVMDNVPPRIISCPDNIAVEAGNEELVFVSWEEPLVSDNSGSWILQEFSPSTSLFLVDTVTDVLYVFEDPSGNQARCEFTVAVLPPSCDPVYADLTEGQVLNISTPFYPEDFPREIICYWNFTSPAGLVVLIEFDVFQLGGAQLIASVGNLSGFQIPAPLISSTSQSSITFTSTNRQFTYPGFHATVKAVNATYYSDVFCDNGGQVLLQEQLFCDGTDHCLDASDEQNCDCTEEDYICYDSNRCVQSYQVCNGIRDCPLRDDEINCHPNCSAENITLMSNQSTPIQSTNFPGFYFPSMECAWIVTAPENHSIIIRTSFLEIGEEDSITIGRGQDALNMSNTICEIESNEIRDVAVDERFAWIRFSSGPGDVTTEGFLLEVVALSQRDFQKETFQCYSGQSIIKSQVCNGVNDCPDFADEDECPPCVAVSQTDCQLLLPYQQTIFPHPLATTPDEASSLFSSLSFLTGCHPSINNLLCSVLFPDCPHTGPVTRPCKSFCLNVTDSCKALYEQTMVSSWPINCDNYDDNLPVGDDGFCNGGNDDVFNTEICGTRPAAPMRGRIVGGTGASFGDWPWIASLRDVFGGHQCGATLITERWAITAAHCIGHVSSAIFGDLYLSMPSNYHHETTFNTHRHPQYNPHTKEHDIALLELHNPVNFTDYVRPSCLSTLTNETDVYERCYIAGWGHLMYEASTVPDRLQEALTHLFTAQECLNYISTNYKEDSMLCAGYDEGGIDTCQGDSGGPLVCEGTDGRWHLVGLTSFGFACALPRLPGVYTRISQHMDFIKSHVG